MKLRILATLAALGLMAATAQAITINDPGVIGTCALNGNTGPSNPTAEAVILNQLLSMGASATQTIPSPGGLIYTTGPTDYNGTATGGLQGPDSGAGKNAVPAGYQFALGKYDGQNAGYVAWFLGGAAMTMPLFPAPLFTSNPEQYELSHYTVFNATTVPDGGSTVALLGAALLAFAVVRRKVRVR